MKYWLLSGLLFISPVFADGEPIPADEVVELYTNKCTAISEVVKEISDYKVAGLSKEEALESFYLKYPITKAGVEEYISKSLEAANIDLYAISDSDMRSYFLAYLDTAYQIRGIAKKMTPWVYKQDFARSETYKDKIFAECIKQHKDYYKY